MGLVTMVLPEGHILQCPCALALAAAASERRRVALSIVQGRVGGRGSFGILYQISEQLKQRITF